MPDVDSPCADLSYAYDGPNALSVTMHFSRVVDHPNRDLVLWFKGAIALRWSCDASGLLELPNPAPRCAGDRWSGWTFPLLTVTRSGWLAEHASREPVEAQGRTHFVLVSMSGVCELLAIPVMATWVDVAVHGCPGLPAPAA